MRSQLYRAIMVSTILCQPLVQACAFTAAAAAQSAPRVQAAQPATAEPAEGGIEQSALTEKQIEGLIAAQKTINALVAKIPEDQLENPNPRIQASLDKAARQFGFRDYGEYDDVGDNISFILDGFDPEKKVFIGHEAVIRKQMADLEADKKIAAQDKDSQMAEMKDALKSLEPVKYPGNIALVTKYYDQLSEIFSDDD